MEDAQNGQVRPLRRQAHHVAGVDRTATTGGRALAIARTPADLFALQRAVGNRAVARALTNAQRSPDDGRVSAKVGQPSAKQPTSRMKGPDTDLQLPWSWGDSRALEQTSSGIRFLIAVAKSKVATTKRSVPRLAARVANDNARIADPARRVMTCFITPATTRFAYWGSRAVLMLDPADADIPTVAHEMGHAIFEAMLHGGAGAGQATQATSGPAATAKNTAAASVPERVADIYLRLEQTRAPKDSTKAVGLMMVDPSWWSRGIRSEHPWTNAGEFFASAKEAYQVNRKGLLSSIKRATKVDTAVGPPAKELLALLDAVFGTGGVKVPTGALPKDRASAAATELRRVKAERTSQIVDSVGAYPLLGWLLDPATRPGRP